MAAQVQQLGGALLNALEKQDAEQLALLRSTHELKILNLTLTLREHQQAEAAESYNALVESKRSAQTGSGTIRVLSARAISRVRASTSAPPGPPRTLTSTPRSAGSAPRWRASW